MSSAPVLRPANPHISSDPGTSNRLVKKATPTQPVPTSSKTGSQNLQTKKVSRKTSKPILTWFQKKLGGSVKAKPLENGQELGVGRAAFANPRSGGGRAVSSPFPQPALSTAARQAAKRDSGSVARHTTFSMADSEEAGEYPLSFDDSTSIDRSSFNRDSLWSPTSALEADDDASLRPIPPSAPPSPSPSRSSSSYLSNPRTFRSMTASTKPTTILSIDLGNGMAHIAQVPQNAPANPVHRIAPHIRQSSSLSGQNHLNNANSITFSALPSSPSRAPSLRQPGGTSSSNGLNLNASTHIQAPLHTAHHPRNNPRPSSPPLDNASMLTLASSAYAHPGRTGLHAYSIATTTLGDNASHYGESLAFPDGESTSQFLLGDDDRLDERDVDASVRALRPRSSRRGSWESEASRWSARVQNGPGTPSLARQYSVWTSNSVRTGAFSKEYRDDDEYASDNEKLEQHDGPSESPPAGDITEDDRSTTDAKSVEKVQTLDVPRDNDSSRVHLHRPSTETIAQTQTASQLVGKTPLVKVDHPTDP